MNKLALSILLAVGAVPALATLPPPDDAAKAKAAEAAAKSAWQAKVDAYQLCKVQDKVAAKYGKHPAAAAPPCTDPGSFAYNPPEQKPLEASGAHSPAGTATSPPSNKAESASMSTKK